jgi:hypothetical protein
LRTLGRCGMIWLDSRSRGENLRMAQRQDSNTVGEVGLGPTTRLVFSISNRSGQRFAHVRKFADTARYSGPTPSGFTIAGDQLSHLVAILRGLAGSVPAAGQSQLGIVRKNKSGEFRVQLVCPDDDMPLPSIDIREHVTTASYVGFTKKGIRFPWDKLPEILNQFEVQLAALGLAEKSEPTLFPEAWPKSAAEIAGEKMRAASSPHTDQLLAPIPDFPRQFLPEKCVLGPPLVLPAEPLELKLGRDGRWAVEAMGGFRHPVRNEIEGKYILFAHGRAQTSVALPTTMVHIFKTVAAYEKHCREEFHRIVLALEMKSRNRQLAEFQTRQLFAKYNLPTGQ